MVTSLFGRLHNLGLLFVEEFQKERTIKKQHYLQLIVFRHTTNCFKTMNNKSYIILVFDRSGNADFEIGYAFEVQ